MTANYRHPTEALVQVMNKEIKALISANSTTRESPVAHAKWWRGLGGGLGGPCLKSKKTGKFQIGRFFQKANRK